MSGDAHRRVHDLLGAYALGLLDDQQRTSVAAHLDGCAECRAELDFVEPAAAFLPLADPRRVTEHPAPPPDLGDRILAAIRDEGAPRARGPRTLVAACAASLVLGLGMGAGAGYAAFAPDPVPLEGVATAVHDSRVDAEADLVPHTWGVEIRLTGTGFEKGETYRATVFDENGGSHPAGEFVGVGADPMVCSLNSALSREAAVGFEITDGRGSPVVSSSF
ncbi:zf-HC2 domain-containing protein [Nocardiopsis sp. ARC36]